MTQSVTAATMTQSTTTSIWTYDWTPPANFIGKIKAFVEATDLAGNLGPGSIFLADRAQS